MFTNKLSHLFYRLVARLIFCRLARGYEEHHGSAEDTYVASIGPLHFEVSDCFVLDHADASISLRMLSRWGLLEVGAQACIGEEQVRRPGLFFHRYSF
ncbi:MAG: hypothetical protein GX605_07105 [Chloroflexi bacterium]|nr:hypothetical protein [Chloroflexota bacterium]